MYKALYELSGMINNLGQRKYTFLIVLEIDPDAIYEFDINEVSEAWIDIIKLIKERIEIHKDEIRKIEYEAKEEGAIIQDIESIAKNIEHFLVNKIKNETFIDATELAFESKKNNIILF